jgi:hypothetical protein
MPNLLLPLAVIKANETPWRFLVSQIWTHGSSMALLLLVADVSGLTGDSRFGGSIQFELKFVIAWSLVLGILNTTIALSRRSDPGAKRQA